MAKEEYTSVVYKVITTYEKATDLTSKLNDLAKQPFTKKKKEISWLIGKEYPPYLVTMSLRESPTSYDGGVCCLSLEIVSPNKGMVKTRVVETLPKELTDVIDKFDLKRAK